MSDECGASTTDGSPCELPGSYPDGRCYHHTDAADADSGGRPTKFTDERARQAIDAAELGKSIEGCGRDAGVDEKTIRNWRDTEGITFEGPDGNEYDFFRAFRRARGDGETYYITEGRDPDGDVDPSFAKFMLASSYKYKKTEKQEVDHSGDVSGFDFTVNWADGDE